MSMLTLLVLGMKILERQTKLEDTIAQEVKNISKTDGRIQVSRQNEIDESHIWKNTCKI